MECVLMNQKPSFKKTISISKKRQITIPQAVYESLGFNKEAECIVRGNELIIRPAQGNMDQELVTQALTDLIAQGYKDNELIEQFKTTLSKIEPAVERMLEEANEIANGTREYSTYEDIFGTEE